MRGLSWVMAYYYKGACMGARVPSGPPSLRTGCQSWGWFYPSFYAPLASDLTDLRSVSLDMPLVRCPVHRSLGRSSARAAGFTISAHGATHGRAAECQVPVASPLPALQVHSSCSAKLLPVPLRRLMLEPTSSILDFYPKARAPAARLCMRTAVRRSSVST